MPALGSRWLRPEDSPDTRDSVQKVAGNARLGNPRDASRDAEGEIPKPLKFS